MYNRGAWSRVQFLVLVERPRLPTGCDGHDEHSAPMDSGLSHEEKRKETKKGLQRIWALDEEELQQPKQ